MITLWLRGLLRRRAGRLLAAAAGIAVAVALLASLGAFLASSQATMTARAVRGVGVDWQVQVQPGADPATVIDTVRATAGVAGQRHRSGFGTSSGLSATTGGSTQTTGAAVVLGLPDDYRALFPSELRTLAGADNGVLLAQQTAANLHVAPGDIITVGRTGLPPADRHRRRGRRPARRPTRCSRPSAPRRRPADRTTGQRAAAAHRPVAAAVRPARRGPPRPGQHPDPRPARPPPARRPRRGLHRR